MSKQFIVKVYKPKGQRVIIYSDGHSNVCAFFEGDPEPAVGDEVVCPTCKEIAEVVKVALAGVKKGFCAPEQEDIL